MITPPGLSLHPALFTIDSVKEVIKCQEDINEQTCPATPLNAFLVLPSLLQCLATTPWPCRWVWRQQLPSLYSVSQICYTVLFITSCPSLYEETQTALVCSSLLLCIRYTISDLIRYALMSTTRNEDMCTLLSKSLCWPRKRLS